MLSDQEILKIFNESVRPVLDDLGFNPETLDTIAKCLPFVQKLNEFASPVGTVLGEGKQQERMGEFAKNETGEKDGLDGSYNFLDHIIFIKESVFKETCKDANGKDQQYWAVMTLAHEISHGTYDRKKYYNNSSAVNYANSVTRDEGEARYYETMVFHSLYAEQPAIMKKIKEEYEAQFWLDNQKNDGWLPVYDKYKGIVDPNPSNYFDDPGKEAKVAALANESAQICFELHGSGRVYFTYDEAAKWEWLVSKSTLAEDLLEAFPHFKEKGESSSAAIEKVPMLSAYLKILLNRANNNPDALYGYLGDNGDNTLKAQENGSALGEKYRHEVLWGGVGTDYLYGSLTQDIKDILLGGDGNDYLFGFGGDDILAGNSGDDHLWGGEGHDKLYGGSGDDKLYGGEGHDHYVFDLTNTNNLAKTIGSDTILDSDGKGSIKFIFGENDIRGLKGGRLISKNETTGVCIYQDWAGPGSRITYTFHPENAASNKGILEIKYGDHLVSTINDFDKGQGNYLSLNLVDNNTSETTQANNSFALKNLYNQVYLYPTKTAAAASTPYGASSELVGPVNVSVTTGNLEDVVFGSEAGEIIDLGGGHDYVVGGAGHDTIYGGAGNDYIVGGKSPVGLGGVPAISSSSNLDSLLHSTYLLS